MGNGARELSGNPHQRGNARRGAGRLEEMVAANPVPTIVYRPADGHVVHANRACLELLGYDEAEFVGRTVDELGLWVDAGHRRETVRRLGHEGRIVGLQDRVRTKGGRELDVVGTVQSTELDGEARLVAVFYDVTEQVRATGELERLGERLRSVLDAAGDGIYGLDAEGRCTFVNRAAADALGYEAHELIGQVVHDLVHHSHEHGSPYPVAECPSTRTLRERAPCRVGNEVLWRRDGTSVPVEYTSFPIVEYGAVSGAVVVFRDVTDRRTADVVIRQLQQLGTQAELLELTHDSVIVRDVEGRITFWNNGAERTYGWPRDEALGRVSHQLLATESTEPLEDIDAALHRDGRWDGRLVQRTRDGRRLVVASRWSLRRGDGGRGDRVFEINIDVTSEAEAERARAAAQEQAERANRAKNEFLSRMSHELRTPLNAILGFAQLLELEDLSVEQRDSTDQIVRAGHHLLQLIDEVLDLSSIEAGALKLSVETVRVRDVVAEVLGMIRPLAAAGEVAVVDHVSTARDLHVCADRQRLKQVLLNLVSNAVKYNCEKGEVHLRCEAVGDQVRLIVEDTGIGIAAHDLESVFVPFERLGAAQTTVEGTGLGLALTKRLVEAIGGEIGVSSTVGKGTTFWVDLAAADEPTERPAVGAAAPGARSPARTGESRLLLYIEDNLTNVKLVERIVARRPEVDLMVAMQASMGLEMARQHRPSLILLDLNLPDMPGEEVLRRLGADARTAGVPVVVLSADASAGQVARLRAAGAADYLTKPFDVDRFLAVVDALAAAPPGATHTPPPGPGTSGDLLDRAIVTQLEEALGDKAAMAEIVATFLKDGKDQILRLGAAAAGGETETARSVAHSLAGSSASVGATGVAELARTVEARARAGEAAGVAHLVGRLRDAWAEAEVALRREFLAAKGAPSPEPVPPRPRATATLPADGTKARVNAVLEHPDALRIVYQPVVDAFTGGIAGVEALARFDVEPRMPPEEWFEAAGRVGLGVQLELLALERAVEHIDELPGEHLSVNLSCDALVAPAFRAFVRRMEDCAHRLVVELTEHAEVAAYDEVVAAVARLRGVGVRVAIDDAGAGYSSFQHILQLGPDVVKLDRSIVADVDMDPARRALASAVADFASDIGAVVVAEGVERLEELRAVRTTGVRLVQGYLTGRPSPLPVVVPPLGFHRGERRALVVDDDPAVRLLVSRILRRNGFEVVGEGADGREGVVLADSLKPDLIVLDLNMPRLGGEQALPRLRASVPGAQVIVLSGGDLPARAPKLRAHGAHALVSKDKIASDLPELVSRLG